MARSEAADAAVWYHLKTGDWAFMCAHCDVNKTYPGRGEAFVIHQAESHLMQHHGIRRTWIETLNESQHRMTQIALPLLFNTAQKARSPYRRSEG